MKNITKYLLLGASVLGLAACQDDETPALTGFENPQLNTLAVSAIDGTSEVVTFTWTEPRFFLEGSNASTSIGSYDYAGISYQLVGDMVGNDFASATVFGSAVSQSYVNIKYDDVAKIMCDKFGMKRDDDTHESAIEFRLMAQYGNLDSMTVVSNSIVVPFVLTPNPPYEGPVPALYICDEAGYGELALYAWGDEEAFGGWPGAQAQVKANKAGKTYWKFQIPDANVNSVLNFIVNNNGQGSQMDLFAGPLKEDTYVTITADGYTIDTQSPKIYIQSQLGWGDYALYAWGDEEVCGGWPGVQPAETVTIGDEQWLVFDLKISNKLEENYIINNNGGGSQFDLVTAQKLENDLFIRVAADGSYKASRGPVQNQPGQFTFYVNKDLSGWPEMAFYVWGDAGEICGGWPGAAPSGPLTINGRQYYYHTFTADVPVNVIINNNNNGSQCGDINGATDQIIFVYGDGSTSSETCF